MYSEWLYDFWKKKSSMKDVMLCLPCLLGKYDILHQRRLFFWSCKTILNISFKSADYKILNDVFRMSIRSIKVFILLFKMVFSCTSIEASKSWKNFFSWTKKKYNDRILIIITSIEILRLSLSIEILRMSVRLL